MTGKLNIEVNQGATFTLELTWYTDQTQTTVVDLTGYTAKMQFRVQKEDTDTLLTLTDGSGITLGGVAGTITIEVTAAQSEDIQDGVYDLLLTSSDSVVTRLIQGNVNYSLNVTR